jgi:hypothetical protein
MDRRLEGEPDDVNISQLLISLSKRSPAASAVKGLLAEKFQDPVEGDTGQFPTLRID